jgi:F420-dependent oxidoreductase-like protein
LPALEFGVKTGQGGYSYLDLLKVWAAAEELGFSSAWLYDHFHSLGKKNESCLEAWVTLAALAAVTKRLKIGTMVTCASYRQPSLLAKMGATVDVLSHGRLIMGVGAGWLEEEYHAYGYQFPDQATRVKQLKETLIIINKMWTEEKASYDGQFYSIRDALCIPKPVQKPRPKILVGIAKGKRTLPYLAVRYADGVNATTGSLQDCEEIIKAVLSYCERYGRRVSDMTISWQGFITIGRTPSELEDRLEKAAKRRGLSALEFRKNAIDRGFIVGEPDECVRRLRQFKELGVNSFFLGFTDDTEVQPLETFRDEVIPQLR